MKKILLLICLITLATELFAVPNEIILIRHGDKLLQSNSGYTLSAKGQIRAINFALYFTKNFDIPDYIFVTDPKKHKSVRQLQTVAPLANLLAEKYPDRNFVISYPYENTEYEKLAEKILTENKYNDKLILICWSHEYLPDFAKALGVKTEIPEWPNYDYDSVYILKYDAHKVSQFTILHNQYPIYFETSWEDLYQRVNGLKY